jgi:ornithine cyclodeaminase
MQSAGLFGLKAVSVFPGNTALGFPVTTGLMLINDSQTGLPLALMDAQYLTALRTGAATGLATQLLANPETETAALFGTGGQAVFQLQAMLEVLPLKTVFVFSRQPANAKQFCETNEGLSPECRFIPAPSVLRLNECGVITTATTSKNPVFADENLSAGVHINGIGSFTPSMAEIPAATMGRATVFVDQRHAALTEAGDIVQAIASGVLPQSFSPAEIGEVLSGRRPGRTDPYETTCFKSVGNAAQDIVCAAEILKIAQSTGLGQVVDL